MDVKQELNEFISIFIILFISLKNYLFEIKNKEESEVYLQNNYLGH